MEVRDDDVLHSVVEVEEEEEQQQQQQQQQQHQEQQQPSIDDFILNAIRRQVHCRSCCCF